jgi:hypothetical protein
MGVTTDVTAAIEAEVATVVGPTFHKLPRKYQPTIGDFNTISKGYAVVQKGTVTFSPPDQACYIVDHRYEVLLADRVIDRGTDDDVSLTVDSLFDLAHDVTSALHRNKLGLIDVLMVSFQDFLEPEFGENGLVLIRVGYSVKYAQALT